METSLVIAEGIFRDVIDHLLRADSDNEEAGFLFVDASIQANSLTLAFREWMPISPDGFASRSPCFLELTDETRGAVIKRAHDLGAAIIEVHSHPGHCEAMFSESDLAGLTEIVPHVRWRLKGKPYAALVFASSGFDALVWSRSSVVPESLRCIELGDRTLAPTGRTLDHRGNIYARRST